jgi:hypothetical protein
MVFSTGLYQVIRLCLVISIILSPFQEVKKTDANHVDTLVSKILFKTLGYVAQVLYMPRLLLPPFLPIFLFTPQSFCCRFVIVVSFTGTAVLWIRDFDLSNLGYFLPDKLLYSTEIADPLILGTGRVLSPRFLCCNTFCSFVYPLAKLWADSGPGSGSGSDDSK